MRPVIRESSPRNPSKVENRLHEYKVLYDHNKSELKEIMLKQECSPSKEKPDINRSSACIVDKRKSEIFSRVFEMLAPKGKESLDRDSMQLHQVSIKIIDIFLDVFTELEESASTWTRETFYLKCNSAYSVTNSH
jgi:hypothetical protein